MFEYVKENYILNVPFGTIEFGFYHEWVMFLGLIILIITSFIFALFGYKYFQATIFLFFGCFFGYIGFFIGEIFTNNPVFIMVFLISFIFLGLMGLFLAASTIFTASKKGNFKNVLTKNMYWISSLLGSLIFALLIYFFVVNEIYIAVGSFIILCVLGYVHQRKNRNKQIRFKTYDDIYFNDMNKNMD
ncbi:MAG TPA: hypothetical protein VJ916_07110 [Anaerovoracaceae bacterium]|nr:hypothetical protein [Anaerovoracaceae bacterium]